MEFWFELYVDEGTQEKLVYVSATEGYGADYPYETFEDVGDAIALYLSDYYLQ